MYAIADPRLKKPPIHGHFQDTARIIIPIRSIIKPADPATNMARRERIMHRILGVHSRRRSKTVFIFVLR